MEVIFLIHQLATAHLVRDQRKHGAPGFRVRHEDNIVPVHLPRHRSYFRLELKVPENKERKENNFFSHASRVWIKNLRGKDSQWKFVITKAQPSLRFSLYPHLEINRIKGGEKRRGREETRPIPVS